MSLDKETFSQYSSIGSTQSFATLPCKAQHALLKVLKHPQPKEVSELLDFSMFLQTRKINMQHNKVVKVLCKCREIENSNIRKVCPQYPPSHVAPMYNF